VVHGEVKKPETINYRTLKPEKDGLFCEKIFGPTKDWECYCGKYKRVRFKGIICERCGVEVTRSKVRRDRMGHIELRPRWCTSGTCAAPARGSPTSSGIEPKEELKAKQLEKVIYFAANLVTWVDEDKRHEDLQSLEAEYLEERDEIARSSSSPRPSVQGARAEEAEAAESEGADTKKLKRERPRRRSSPSASATRSSSTSSSEPGTSSRSLFSRKIIEDEMLWRELEDRYGDYFEGGMGADAIKQLIDRIDFDEEEIKLRAAIDPQEGQQAAVGPAQAEGDQAPQDRGVVQPSRRARPRINDPKAMILDVVPVIPPELRPMVQLDGGRFATSDLNDLYRRVINRNNRLKRLLDLGAPRSSSTTRSACCRRPSTRCSTTAAAAVRSPGRATVRSSRSPTC
jgi:DNA-directed RNA polymerase subunit beta'